MIFLAKFLSIVLALVVISKSYVGYRNKQESLTMFLFWLITWLLIVVLSLFPIIIEKANHLIGQSGTGVDTFFGLTFVLLFFVTYRVYLKANRLEQKMREMVIKVGLRDLSDPNDQS